MRNKSPFNATGICSLPKVTSIWQLLKKSSPGNFLIRPSASPPKTSASTRIRTAPSRATASGRAATIQLSPFPNCSRLAANANLEQLGNGESCIVAARREAVARDGAVRMRVDADVFGGDADGRIRKLPGDDFLSSCHIDVTFGSEQIPVALKGDLLRIGQSQFAQDRRSRGRARLGSLRCDRAERAEGEGGAERACQKLAAAHFGN